MSNKQEIAKKFQDSKERYSRLGQNIVDALKTFLDEKETPFLDIYFRVKKFDSFYEKIDRKKYKNPFEDIEDICGVRVICYYASDVEKVCDIIAKEFNILEKENKSDSLGLKEFAYRSHHFIVKINENWNLAPNYRNLEDLKAEIQVRTILMHAWAEIEHKLNYKSDKQVPEIFQRKLFRLSAKFEEADEQFEELKVGIQDYRSKLKDDVAGENKFNLEQDFNLDSFKVFIAYKFPEDQWDEDALSGTFEEWSNTGFQKLNDAIDKFKPHQKEIIRLLQKHEYDTRHFKESHILLFFAMSVLEEYYLLKNNIVEPWKKAVQEWKGENGSNI